MNGSVIENIENLKSLLEQGHAIVAVKFCISDHSVATLVYPEENYVGTAMFHSMALSRFKSDGYLTLGSGFAFPLNRSFHLFLLNPSARGPALLSLSNLLEEQQFHGFSKVGWFDHREDCWRAYFPKSAEFKCPSLVEIEADMAQIELKRKMVAAISNNEV
jgi:hypothetical protein